MIPSCTRLQGPFSTTCVQALHSTFLFFSIIWKHLSVLLSFRGFPGGPVVWTPCFHCQGSGWSLVRELRFYKLLNAAKFKKKKNYCLLYLVEPALYRSIHYMFFGKYLIITCIIRSWALQVAQWERNHLPMQEPRVQSLGLEDPPRGGNGNPLQYSCRGNPRDRGAWPQSMGLQRVGYNRQTWTNTHTHI